MLDTLLIFLLTGVLAGFLAGLLGIGGGLVVVPVLFFIFSTDAATAEDAMHLALGSSLAFIVLNSGIAARTHARLGGVRWEEVKWLAPGLVSGSLLGAFVAGLLPTSALRLWFGVFLLLMAVWIFLQKKPALETRVPRFVSIVAGIPIGGLASLAGVGGGVMVVPWLMVRGFRPAQAVATSSFCTVIVAAIGSVGYAVFATEVPLAWTTGYIYWPAVLGIAMTALVFAPLGAKAAHRVNQKILRKGFAVLLLVVSVRLIMG